MVVQNCKPSYVAGICERTVFPGQPYLKNNLRTKRATEVAQVLELMASKLGALSVNTGI
jgi:hypothetical protein